MTWKGVSAGIPAGDYYFVAEADVSGGEDPYESDDQDFTIE
jgi:hypothetical protein